MTCRIINHKWSSKFRPEKASPMWDVLMNPVDLTFADPPYNYGVKYDGDETGDKLSTEDYREWTASVMFQLSNATRRGGMIWWLCPAEDGHWVWPEITKYGFLLQGKPIIWYERFSQYQKHLLTSDYRLLFPLVVGAGPITFNPDDIRVPSVRLERGDPRANPKGRIPGHVWKCPRLQGNAKARVDWHPAQIGPFPLEQIVNGFTNKGDTVLDAFAGSGSMGAVCNRLGRNFVGIDASEKYCNLIDQRLKEAPGEK